MQFNSRKTIYKRVNYYFKAFLDKKNIDPVKPPKEYLFYVSTKKIREHQV